MQTRKYPALTTKNVLRWAWEFVQGFVVTGAIISALLYGVLITIENLGG